MKINKKQLRQIIMKEANDIMTEDYEHAGEPDGTDLGPGDDQLTPTNVAVEGFEVWKDMNKKVLENVEGIADEHGFGAASFYLLKTLPAEMIKTVFDLMSDPKTLHDLQRMYVNRGLSEALLLWYTICATEYDFGVR